MDSPERVSGVRSCLHFGPYSLPFVSTICPQSLAAILSHVQLDWMPLVSKHFMRGPNMVDVTISPTKQQQHIDEFNI